MISVIYILWLRQLKRYFRSKSRIVGALGQPLLYMLALGFGLGPVFAKAGNGNYLQFLVPGVIAQSILFTSIFAGIEVIWDKQFGFLKETLVAPVSRFEIMLGRVLGGTTVATLQGTIVLGISYLLGFRAHNIVLLPTVILIMALIALLFTSLGTAIASMLDDMQGFQLIMNFLVLPLYFLSGALFPLKGIPQFLKIITSFDPLTYGVDALRTLLIGTSQLSLSLDILVLGTLAGLLLAIGSYLFSKIQI
ncbi:MAG TPA: ABC transporter permease [Patescibacteria group bacterium]|nr:ABC transporter permease [Patescibacteria group bacterium]